MLKRHRSSVVELLPHDIIELILERLPVKSLRSFKSVSKQWKSTIDSKRFQERQFNRRTQSRDPDVFFLSTDDTDNGAGRRRLVLGSSIFFTLKLPFPTNMVCYGTCDGLICMYRLSLSVTTNLVANPATKWHRSFPFSRLQHLIVELRADKKKAFYPTPSKLGFGKDKFRGTYKPVWLYNSSDYEGLDNATTCEVFDFTTNAWRYVLPASPYRILPYQKPVYFDGSLHWFTECGESTKIVSFDLHTETFQVLCKAPFSHVHPPHDVIMCVLDNRLCVSQRNWPNQVIWSLFDSSVGGGSRTWKKMWCIDLSKTLSWFGDSKYALFPVAVLGKNKLLLQGREYVHPLVMHDLLTKSFDLLFTPTTSGCCSFYFESLLSV